MLEIFTSCFKSNQKQKKKFPNWSSNKIIVYTDNNEQTNLKH